jgi:hypothetical protein
MRQRPVRPWRFEAKKIVRPSAVGRGEAFDPSVVI